jgi:hypothetical protein
LKQEIEQTNLEITVDTNDDDTLNNEARKSWFRFIFSFISVRGGSSSKLNFLFGSGIVLFRVIVHLYSTAYWEMSPHPKLYLKGYPSETETPGRVLVR